MATFNEKGTDFRKLLDCNKFMKEVVQELLTANNSLEN